MGRNFCIRVFYYFFLLHSSQNQVPQIIVGTGRIINHFKALSVVIRRKLKNFENLLKKVEENGFEIFDFWSNLANKLSLIIAYLNRENWVILR